MSYTQAQINAMSVDQWVSAGGPVAIDAPYAETYDPLMQDPGYNPSAVTSGTLRQSQSTAPASTGFFTGLSGGLQSLSPLPSLFGSLGQSAPSATPAAAGGGGWSSFWAFFGNPARMGTVVIGGLMIAAGVFSLSRSTPNINISLPAGGRGSTERGETGRKHDRTETMHVKF